MKIVASNIKSIKAERKNQNNNKLKIESGIDIHNIEKTDTSLSNKQGTKFDFKMTIDYTPKIASIVIEGSILALDEKDESKEILKQWKKKKIDQRLKMFLFNFILDRYTLKTLTLEEDLGLPTHVPFPKLSFKNNENQNPANYTG